MKRMLMIILLAAPIAMLTGCCTDDLCNARGTVNMVSSCSKCNKTCNYTCNACNSCSTCNTCGYDASYTYSGWY